MKLEELLEKIHVNCSRLCFDVLGYSLPVAGNIAVFCQNQEQYERLQKDAQEKTRPSDNPAQKYFELKTPIVFPVIEDVPGATYTHLYIRKPNSASPEAGDVDFILPTDEFRGLKEKVIQGTLPSGVSVYNRPGWDMIEIRNPLIDGLAYVSTKEMAEKVRVRF